MDEMTLPSLEVCINDTLPQGLFFFFLISNENLLKKG